MKTMFIIGISLLFMSTEVSSQKRSPEQAAMIANSFRPHQSSSAAKGITGSASQMTLYKTSSDIIGTSAQADGEAFYVFTPQQAGQKGFVIVSGDERMADILGYSTEGYFDAGQMPPSMSLLFNHYAEEMKMLNESTSARKVHLLRSPLSKVLGMMSEQQDPLMMTQWNQGSPYNSQCPMDDGVCSATGCIATAAAQVMKYFRYPTKGKGSTSYTTRTNFIPVSYDFANTTFNWSSMINRYTTGNYTMDQAEAVSTLMAACGAACSMDYTKSASGSNITKMAQGFCNYLSYDEDLHVLNHGHHSEEDWQAIIIKEIDEGRPVFYTGDNDNSGHAFVLDGYTADDDNYPYFHVNWGWGGYCDGNFKTTSLDPGVGGIGSSEGGYNQNMSIMLGLQPENNVKDIDSYWLGATMNINPMYIKPETAANVKISMTNLFNFAVKTFTGNLSFFLVKPDGTETNLGGISLNDCPFFSGLGSTNITVSIPKSVAEGSYTIYAATSTDGVSYQRIPFQSGDAVLTVTNDYKPNIQSTAVSFTNPADNNGSVQATVNSLYNLDSQTSEGVISMAVTDLANNVVKTFGETLSYNLTGMGGYGSATTLKGTVPTDIPVGHYRLQLAAKDNAFTSWGIVKKCVIENNTITGRDSLVYQDIWITAGGVSTDNPCTSPVITYSNGVFTYSCTDEGAVIHHTVSVTENDKGQVIVTATAYATKDDFTPSLPASMSINLSDQQKDDVNGDGEVNIKDVTDLVNNILKKK